MIADALDAFDRRHERPRAGIDEDFVRLEIVLRAVVRGDAHRVCAGEARVAGEHGHVGRAAQPSLDACAGLPDHTVLARLHLRHVDPDRSVDQHAVIGRTARHVRRPRARDVGLGRRAADIHASAAERRALDDGGLAAARSKAHGKRRAALSRADHDGVEMLWHGGSPWARGYRAILRPALGSFGDFGADDVAIRAVRR